MGRDEETYTSMRRRQDYIQADWLAVVFYAEETRVGVFGDGVPYYPFPFLF